MIDRCNQDDFDEIYTIINDGAEAYRGVIPADRWHDPYMSQDALRHEIDSGVEFWCWRDDDNLAGVMGIQDVQDVTLIRHAYVRTTRQGQGIGGKLLAELHKLTSRPVLIGTWAAAIWAIGFYEKHGFRLVTPVEKDRLLKKHWSIPDRQVETSVVLGDERWFMATLEDFQKVDARVGVVSEVMPFADGKYSTHILMIDFGPDLGVKKSLARLSPNYDGPELFGRQVLCVVNFPPRQIGKHLSEVLTLGVPDEDGNVVLIKPERDVPLGRRLY